jgi:hypothetical protein
MTQRHSTPDAGISIDASDAAQSMRNETPISDAGTNAPRQEVSPTQALTVGGNGTDGRLTILSADGKPIADMQAATANPRRQDIELALGGNGRNGLLRIRRLKDDRQTTIADNGMSLYGHFSMHSSDRNPVNINPHGDQMRMLLGDTGVAAYVQLTNGANGPGPIIEIDGKRNAISLGDPGSSTSKIDIVGQEATARFGGEKVNGSVIVQGGDGKARATINAADASIRVGGNGSNGTVSVLGADGQPLLELLGRSNECVMGLGQKNRPARISLYGANQQEAIRLDAAAGDIMLMNADCAEEFDLAVQDAQPGTVMVLTDDGRLAPSSEPYDTRVTGVVSGAGAFRPGLILDRRDTGMPRVPVALMGKVYCWVDATRAAIGVGDLLTTAEVRGHAMKVTDLTRAIGAIIGKALAPLAAGRQLIPILVTAR